MSFDPKNDFKTVFPLSRTTVAHVLMLDGFCDGLCELGAMIAKSVSSGNSEPRPVPKGAIDVSDPVMNPEEIAVLTGCLCGGRLNLARGRR